MLHYEKMSFVNDGETIRIYVMGEWSLGYSFVGSLTLEQMQQLMQNENNIDTTIVL